MSEVTTIGLDLVKSVFQVHGVVELRCCAKRRMRACTAGAKVFECGMESGTWTEGRDSGETEHAAGKTFVEDTWKLLGLAAWKNKTPLNYYFKGVLCWLRGQD